MRITILARVIARKIIIIGLSIVWTGSSAQFFTNPLLPSGPDPWSTYKDGYYYYTHTLQDSLVIWKIKNLADLKTAERKTIFIPPPNTNWSKELWAPEIHFLDNKWYVYFAADDGNNNNHRMFVLENKSLDPFLGTWNLKGKVADRSNKWAIDGSVFYHRNKLYMVWAGWEGDINKKQDIYIAKMRNPWSIKGKRVKISSPQYDWEKHGDINDSANPPHVDVNEGPQILKHNKNLFLIYSASGCWTDYYALGMLRLTGRKLKSALSWTKSMQPVFKEAPENGVFAPGHNSFFKSPDGTEDWILYHANAERGQGCGDYRSPRTQKFSWNEDGTPNFGKPVKAGEILNIPSQNK
ncbi:MAG: glycoside hydrolase family 43 protein [Flavobacterium sp.]|nr:glycoside hydrolase family 43 protein [Pedobacter sp.]